MATKYVDDNGLLYFWQKIKNKFALKANTLAGYGITDAMTSTEVNTAISNALNGITGISYQIVGSLPLAGEPGVIYLIGSGGEDPDAYDEYIYANNRFEKIGSTNSAEIDLDDYVQKTDLVAVTNGEIDTIVAS